MKGPEEQARRSMWLHLLGRVEDAARRAVDGPLETPEGHSLNGLTALTYVSRTLPGGVAAGMHAPSPTFGAGLIREIPGRELRIGG